MSFNHFSARLVADPNAVEQLALANQPEFSQHLAPPGYMNMGMLQAQQMQNYGMQQMPSHLQGGNNFQFPQAVPQQHLNVPINAPTQPSGHRRNQSGVGGGANMGPPPPPGSYLYMMPDESPTYYSYQGRENMPPRGRGNGPPGSGHARRHSLALPEAKKAAEAAEQKRKTAQFQFPGPGAAETQPSTSPTEASSQQSSANLGSGRGRGASHGRSQSMAVGNGRGNTGRNFQFPNSGNNNNNNQNDYASRGGSHGHARSGSRNFDGNWRQPQNQNNQDQQSQQAPMGSFTANAPSFQPGHRARGSMNQSIGSIGNFQYGGQPQILQLPSGPVLIPQILPGQPLNNFQLAQLQAFQQMNGGMQGSQHAPHMSMVVTKRNSERPFSLLICHKPICRLCWLMVNSWLVSYV